MTKEKQQAPGQALVEFALVFPILVFLLMGMFDLGRAVYAYSVLGSAAREGARYGTIDPNHPDKIQSQAFANVPGIEVSSLSMDAPVCKNGSGDLSSCTSGNTITIAVHYAFQPITAFFASIDMTGQSTMTIE